MGKKKSRITLGKSISIFKHLTKKKIIWKLYAELYEKCLKWRHQSRHVRQPKVQLVNFASLNKARQTAWSHIFSSSKSHIYPKISSSSHRHQFLHQLFRIFMFLFVVVNGPRRPRSPGLGRVDPKSSLIGWVKVRVKVIFSSWDIWRRHLWRFLKSDAKQNASKSV